MNKSLKTGLKIGSIIALFGILLILIIRYTTKAHSPEDIVTYSEGNLQIEVVYNRPFKKDREIFGSLVPYNEVWRTGANEATTFETNQDILVDGSILKAGKYTLWTIPMEGSWKVIFNSQMYPWGINLDKEAYRDAAYDSLILERPVEKIEKPLEQFTIQFEENSDFITLVLAWDRIRINVPLKREEAPEGTSFAQ